MTNGVDATDANGAAAEEPRAALEGLRVLDLSTSVAGAWCGRMLADFGADVVLIEPREGHPIRALAPFAPDGSSVIASHVQANKRSVALDVGDERARTLLWRLLRHTDVVIETYAPGRMAEMGLGYAALEARSHGVILCSVTPHGQTGANAQYPGNDLTAYARSGWASINGLAEREPLKGSGYNASYQAGTAAYAAIMAALYHRDLHPGEGQHIDVSEVEVLSATAAPALLGAQYRGQPAGRREVMDVSSGPVPVEDGYFALTLSRAHFWRDAMNLLGLADLAEDRRWDTSWYRQQHREEYAPRVGGAMAQWRKMELFDALAALRVVAGPVLTMDELMENPHLRERDYFARPDGTADGAPEYAGAPAKLSATPWRLRRRAPKHGEHTFEVLRNEGGVTDDHLLGHLESGVIGSAVST